MESIHQDYFLAYNRADIPRSYANLCAHIKKLETIKLESIHFKVWKVFIFEVWKVFIFKVSKVYGFQTFNGMIMREDDRRKTYSGDKNKFGQK